MSYTLGKLAHVIHVTGDLAGASALYRDVFGGACYYEGYSPAEKRDAAIYAIGDFVIEPMGPAAEPGAERMPVGRFHGRFGDHLHSIAVNVQGVPELYEHLRDHGIRVVGPGGSDPTAMPDGGVQSIYTHPKDTSCLLEFVDFGSELMPGCPRLEPDWDPTPWRDDHGLHTDGLSHVAVVVADLDRSTEFFASVLGCPPFHEADTAGVVRRYVALGTEAVVELAQPVTNGTRLADDLAANGDIVHSVTIRSTDIDEAGAHLERHGIGLATRSDSTIVLDPASTFGAVIALSEDRLPGDPRIA